MQHSENHISTSVDWIFKFPPLPPMIAEVEIKKIKDFKTMHYFLDTHKANVICIWTCL